MNLISKSNRNFAIRLLRRRLPMTTFHWRYLFPGANRALRVQRAVFLRQNQRFPISLRIAAWFFLQFKWWIYGAPIATYTAYRDHSARYASLANKPSWGQFFDLMRLAYGFSIPPRLYYTMELYSYPRSEWHSFVFDFQTPVWHSALMAKGVDRSLMHDKYQFSEYLQLAGVKTIPTLARFPELDSRGESDCSIASNCDWYDELPQAFFCKPVSASQSVGCIGVEKLDQHHKMRINSLYDCLLFPNTDLAKLRELLVSRDYMIQPMLTNAESLTEMLGQMLSVFRIVTMRGKSGIVCVYAHLNCTLLGKSEPLVSVMINPFSGACTVEPSFYTPEQNQNILDKLFPLSSWVESHWTELSKICLKAHDKFAQFFSVGWDVACTQDGVTLVEGNIFWATDLHQALERTPILSSTHAKLIDQQIKKLQS